MFISIEGIEGAGKSTVVQKLAAYLTQANVPLCLTREPGGTAVAETLRQVLLHGNDEEIIADESELLLMFAGRAQHLKNKILPALDAGQWVLSDRFVDASYAYQGGGRGLSKEWIAALDQWIVGAHLPNLTFLLDIDPVLGLQRTSMRPLAKDRIEKEQTSFFARVRAEYLARAKQFPQRIKIIQAHLPLDEVLAQIYPHLQTLLAGRQ